MSSKEMKEIVLNEINKIDIIDIHTHLREDKLTASAIDILSYHWVLSELNSVGMDYQNLLLNGKLSLEEKYMNVIPYYQKMGNTATAWCVKTVFKDLYGFDEELTLQNYKKLIELSESKCNDEKWTENVTDKTRIKKFVTSVGNASKYGNAKKNFDLMVDLHYLFNPSMAVDLDPWFTEFYKDETKYLEALGKIADKRILNSNDIIEGLEHFVNENYKERAKYFNTVIFVEFRFMEIDKSDIDIIIERWNKGFTPSEKEMNLLICFVTWNILRILDSLKSTFQICIGAEYQICGGRSVSRYDTTWVRDMVKICYTFPHIKFDFMCASKIMFHEMAVAAKMIRNFHIQSMWWHTYLPSCIQSLSEYLEIVPAVKLGGFFCDAYYLEMTYGKLQMVKNSFAEALSNKIESGFYSEKSAIDIAVRLFNKNPLELYGLEQS